MRIFGGVEFFFLSKEGYEVIVFLHFRERSVCSGARERFFKILFFLKNLLDLCFQKSLNKKPFPPDWRERMNFKVL